MNSKRSRFYSDESQTEVYKGEAQAQKTWYTDHYSSEKKLDRQFTFAINSVLSLQIEADFHCLVILRAYARK